MGRLYIARQPVFDRAEQIFAYDFTALAPSVRTSASADDLIAELFLDIGIDQVAPEQRAFIPLDAERLFSRGLPALPRDRVIVEIPAALNGDARTLNACRALRGAGYSVATYATRPNDPLARSSDVVKVDVASTNAADLAAIAESMKRLDGQLLAVNVPHRAERDRCAELGFQLFQGYRFAAPETYSTKVIPIQHLHAFQLLQLVRDPAVSDEEIELFLRRDVGLAYRLLRMVNSAAIGGRELTSIGHALRLLGRESLSRWLCVLLATQAQESGVKAELIQAALVRARMCEKMAEVVHQRSARGPLFLVGMLSVFDQILEVHVEALCESVGLARDLRDALTKRSGVFGIVLSLVDSYIGAHWNALDTAARVLAIEPDVLPPIYLEALAWAAGGHGPRRTESRRVGPANELA